ncbi:hypothetical protein D9M71_480250 [compost metagenome]
MRRLQKYRIGIDEHGLVRPLPGLGNGAGLAPMGVAAVAGPGLQGLLVQCDHFHRPAGKGLWLVGKHADHRQLSRLATSQGGKDAKFCLQLIDPALAIKEVDQLLRYIRDRAGHIHLADQG